MAADGRTLYGTIGDVFNDGPQCPSPDPDVEVCDLWAPVLADHGSELPAGLNEADYTLFETADGYHVAYRRSVELGLPLYTWIGEGPGEYNGQGHDGNWFVVSEEGKLFNDFEPPS